MDDNKISKAVLRIKNRANTIKRESGVKHYRALWLACREEGFDTYEEFLSAHKDAEVIKTNTGGESE